VFYLRLGYVSDWQQIATEAAERIKEADEAVMQDLGEQKPMLENNKIAAALNEEIGEPKWRD